MRGNRGGSASVLVCTTALVCSDVLGPADVLLLPLLLLRTAAMVCTGALVDIGGLLVLNAGMKRLNLLVRVSVCVPGICHLLLR